MNKKVLLIGGSGFIGQGLYSQFHQKHNVYFTGRKKNNHPNYRFLDINDKKSITKVLKEYSYDFIFILPAVIDINFNDADFDSELFKTNLFGLNILITTIKDHQQKTKLIYLSSMTVYDKESKSPVKETASLKPLHSYGLSKVYAEQLFSFYCSRYSLKGIIFRIPGVYGTFRKSGFIFNTAQQLKHNKNIVVDTTNLGYWETINLKDLTSMIHEIMITYPFREDIEVFNLSYGQEIDIIQTAFLLKEYLHSKSNIKVTKKDYNTFYMSNNKIKPFLKMKYSFKRSLKEYLNTI